MTFDNIIKELINNNTIASEQYIKLEVKRGLRNSNGSGVLAGLSRISSVTGSKNENGVLIPTEGILKYRNILIQDLIKKTNSFSKFEYTIFLLLVGRHPTKKEYHLINTFLSDNRSIPREFIDHLIRAIPSKNIMNKLQTVVSSLYTLDKTPESLAPYENFMKALLIISKMPSIVAISYLLAYDTNPTIVTPDPSMNTATAILYILRQGEIPSTFESEVLDLALCLHAEHGGGNNSSFTTYVVTSSGADIYGTITAALGSLKGPLHGAANKMVMDMMANIKSNVKDWSNKSEVRNYLKQIILKKAYDKSGKLYGLGHAVYTKSDPRALILKEKAHELAEKVNRMDEFNLYCLIEKEGPQIFNEVKGSTKTISPNVDFFSGFVYDCLGIPQEIYTPLFAVARTTGWCAHRIEEILSGKRVIRPSYKFI